MVCAFITLLSMVGTSWVKDHPSLVKGLLIALPLGAIGCFIFWLCTAPRKVDSSPSLNKGSLIGGDNLGKQSSAGRDLIDSSTHVEGDYHYHASPTGRPTPTPSDPPKITLPSLAIRRAWQQVVYDASPGLWRVASQGDTNYSLMLLLWVANPLPETRGAHGTNLSNLVAHIKIEHYITVQITNSYWVDELSNLVELRAGSERAIVVGQFINDDIFGSYENPYAPDYEPYFSVPFRELGTRRDIKLMKRDSASPIDIRVSIVDSSSNQVIDFRRLRIHLPARITEMLDE